MNKKNQQLKQQPSEYYDNNIKLAQCLPAVCVYVCVEYIAEVANLRCIFLILIHWATYIWIFIFFCDQPNVEAKPRETLRS